MTTKSCKSYFKILKENTIICKNNLDKKCDYICKNFR